MKKLLIVIASQDYESANHRGLWVELSRLTDVLVINIPADHLISRITGKAYRIKDAKEGIKQINSHLYLLRPLFLSRPEIMPDYMFSLIASAFWKQVGTVFRNLDDYAIDILTYDGRWVKILLNTQRNLRFAYYLYDEVRNNGNDNSVSKTRTRYDDYACKFSNVIFTMTEVLAKSRNSYKKPIIVIGNGSSIPKRKRNAPDYHLNKSAAFIGNFRDWIDQDLLTELVEKRKDVLFCFVGSVENNMKEYFIGLLNNNVNTSYFGKVSKEIIPDVYRMFDCVIIPYRDNEFVKATRPIKIVESVFAGTPVVTVPMNGYAENEFIRFANSAESFSQQMDKIFESDVITENLTEYETFIDENSWKRKAEIIVDSLEKLRSQL